MRAARRLAGEAKPSLSLGMRVLIIGCGYVGLPLGAELARAGHHVFGVRRSGGRQRELVDAGIEPVIADITRASEFEKFPPQLEWIVNTVSSSRGGPDEYRRIYLEATRRLI